MRPLFVTGIARGGTTLLARILNETPGINLASDPYLPLFCQIRQALVRDAGMDTGLTIPDYYFTDMAELDAVQNGNWDALIGDLTETRWAVNERAMYEARWLSAAVEGTTCREVMDNALAAVGGEVYGGTKEVWSVEFFGSLARAYPDAHFVLIVRDPRAVVASLLRLGKIGHPLSYARHWRKAMAFVQHYDFVHLLRYEDLVANPKAELEDLGDSLEIAIPTPKDIHPAREWKLAPDVQAMVELVCDPEMRLAGYEPDHVSGDILGHLIETDEWPVSWRGEVRDPADDYELELSRTWNADIRAAFLFEEAHRAALQWSAI